MYRRHFSKHIDRIRLNGKITFILLYYTLASTNAISIPMITLWS